MTEHATTLIVGVGHLAEAFTGHVRNAVVLRQPLVHEGRIGTEHREHATIVAHHVFEKQLRLALHALRELEIEVGEQERVGMHLLEILQAQPLRGEARGECVGARISEHALHLRLEHQRRVQRLRARRGQQAIIGDRAPQEE